ncbi:hypothetical protein PR048_022386 [Dryococelus australis]|uniref:Uncharacterized protein n=1 Tax=Dryococelus australis TaxID=614101 RepID=A0ABQ9H102_9NEOP|nr:hypothetical protein PR048_022386 [Dryococelus australis]
MLKQRSLGLEHTTPYASSKFTQYSTQLLCLQQNFLLQWNDENHLLFALNTLRLDWTGLDEREDAEDNFQNTLRHQRFRKTHARFASSEGHCDVYNLLGGRDGMQWSMPNMFEPSPGFDSGFSQMGIVSDKAALQVGFFWDFPFLPPLHSIVAPYSHFTLIGSDEFGPLRKFIREKQAAQIIGHVTYNTSSSSSSYKVYVALCFNKTVTSATEPGKHCFCKSYLHKEKVKRGGGREKDDRCSQKRIKVVRCAVARSRRQMAGAPPLRAELVETPTARWQERSLRTCRLPYVEQNVASHREKGIRIKEREPGEVIFARSTCWRKYAYPPSPINFAPPPNNPTDGTRQPLGVTWLGRATNQEPRGGGGGGPEPHYYDNIQKRKINAGRGREQIDEKKRPRERAAAIISGLAIHPAHLKRELEVVGREMEEHNYTRQGCASLRAHNRQQPWRGMAAKTQGLLGQLYSDLLHAKYLEEPALDLATDFYASKIVGSDVEVLTQCKFPLCRSTNTPVQKFDTCEKRRAGLRDRPIVQASQPDEYRLFTVKWSGVRKRECAEESATVAPAGELQRRDCRVSRNNEPAGASTAKTRPTNVSSPHAVSAQTTEPNMRVRAGPELPSAGGMGAYGPSFCAVNAPRIHLMCHAIAHALASHCARRPSRTSYPPPPPGTKFREMRHHSVTKYGRYSVAMQFILSAETVLSNGKKLETPEVNTQRSAFIRRANNSQTLRGHILDNLAPHPSSVGDHLRLWPAREYETAPECKGGGNGRPPRETHRQVASSRWGKSGSDTGSRFALLGSERSSHCATAAPVMVIDTERCVSTACCNKAGKREILEITRGPTASSGTIPTFEDPGMTRPGIELGSPGWKASRLPTTPLLPLVLRSEDGNTARHARRSDEALGVRVIAARIAPSFLTLNAVFPRGSIPLLTVSGKLRNLHIFAIRRQTGTSTAVLNTQHHSGRAAINSQQVPTPHDVGWRREGRQKKKTKTKKALIQPAASGVKTAARARGERGMYGSMGRGWGRGVGTISQFAVLPARGAVASADCFFSPTPPATATPARPGDPGQAPAPHNARLLAISRHTHDNPLTPHHSHSPAGGCVIHPATRPPRHPCTQDDIHSLLRTYPTRLSKCQPPAAQSVGTPPIWVAGGFVFESRANCARFPARVTPQISACENRTGLCRWSADFLSDLPFPPPLAFRRCYILASLHPHRLSTPRFVTPLAANLAILATCQPVFPSAFLKGGKTRVSRQNRRLGRGSCRGKRLGIGEIGRKRLGIGEIGRKRTGSQICALLN